MSRNQSINRAIIMSRIDHVKVSKLSFIHALVIDVQRQCIFGDRDLLSIDVDYGLTMWRKDVLSPVAHTSLFKVTYISHGKNCLMVRWVKTMNHVSLISENIVFASVASFSCNHLLTFSLNYIFSANSSEGVLFFSEGFLWCPGYER